MIVERLAAKKPWAVTLALVIGFSFPGTVVWSQAYETRVVAAIPGAGAQFGAVLSGVQPAGPSLTANSFTLSAPAAFPAILAASPALAANPIAAMPALAPAAALRAQIPVAAAEKPAKAPADPVSSRAKLDGISRIAGESGGEAGAVEIVSIGRYFDGSRPSSADVRTVSGETSRGVSAGSFHPLPAPTAAASAKANATQQRMLQSLYQVASIFAEQYAPLDMKKDLFQLDLKREYDSAKAQILADPNITTRGFQDILAKLTSSMRDYHVSISFNSTESSKLPFQVAGAKGRYYLTYIDREKLSKEAFPFKMGDEVVSFGGQPTAAAIKAIAAQMTGNTPQTDLRMAELFLTNRRRARGDKDIPKGAAEMVIRSKGKLYKVRMPWDYTPELVSQNVPLRNAGLLEPEGLGGAPAPGPVGRAFFDAVHPLADLFSDIRAESSDNAFMIGARKSFVPRLGKILWQSEDDSHFHAYIFEAKDGRKMGYIRIAAYDGKNKEVREFAKIMAKFQAETEALVIDQVSNPGGSVYYLYALAAHLTDKPLSAPRHRFIIGEGEAQQSAEMLLKAMRNSKKPAAAAGAKENKPQNIENEEKETPNADGYPITAKFMGLMLRYAQFILQQFNSGKRFTDLFHVQGVADIDPAPKEGERYTKPVLLLTNALDFSGGDFFPAIMQDNRRATILGVRTAGAGGIVKPFAVNQFGIAHLSATASLAQRANGQPIENLGVTPDVPYELTARDLRTGFAEYRRKILKTLDGMLAPAK